MYGGRTFPNDLPSTVLLEGRHVTGRSVEGPIPCAMLETYRTEAIRTPRSLHDCPALWGGWGIVTIGDLAGGDA